MDAVKPTRGRPRGSKNKRTAETEALYDRLKRKYKHDPMEYMFQVASNSLPPDIDSEGNEIPVEVPIAIRIDASKELLPYRHAKRTKAELDVQAGAGQITFAWAVEDGSGDFKLPTAPSADSAAPEAGEIQG